MTKDKRFDMDRSMCQRSIAYNQLGKALGLFLDGDYVPALTLAGAAEHILAGLISRNGGTQWKSALERMQEAEDDLDIPPDMRRGHNATRNWLKHPDLKNPDARIDYYIVFQDCCLMLCRAYANFAASDPQHVALAKRSIQAVVFRLHEVHKHMEEAGLFFDTPGDAPQLH